MAENDHIDPAAPAPGAGGPPTDLGNAKLADGQPGKGGPPPPPADGATVVAAKPLATPQADGGKTPAAGEAPPVVAAKPAAAGTLADGERKPTEAEAAVKGKWPEDWRQELAGDDKKLLARLERYGSPKDILTAYRALEQRVSAGELKRALSKNPTAEELAEFRKSNGIPEKPEDYEVDLGKGIVWGEADKEMIESFKPAAHDLNLTGSQVKGVLGWVAQMQDSIKDAQAEADERDAINGSEKMRADFGDKFKPTMNAARNYFPADDVAWNSIMGARGEDGRKLGNNPEIMAFFAAKAREANPFATEPPMGNMTPQQSAETRFQELDGMMKAGANSEKGWAYYRGPNREALQAEWRDIFDKLDTIKKRSAA